MTFKKTCEKCGEVFDSKACPKCLGRSFAKTLEDKPAYTTDERLDYIAARLTEIRDVLRVISRHTFWLCFLAWLFAVLAVLAAMGSFPVH